MNITKVNTDHNANCEFLDFLSIESPHIIDFLNLSIAKPENNVGTAPTKNSILFLGSILKLYKGKAARYIIAVMCIYNLILFKTSLNIDIFLLKE